MADRLLFLSRTLDGIIKRFEDEFPETKEAADSAVSLSAPESNPLEKTPTRTSLSSIEAEREPSAGASDNEDDPTTSEVRTGVGRLSRQSSNLSLSSLRLNREEGHAHRAGHKFRVGWMLTSEQYQLLASTALEDMEKNPALTRVFNEMLDELGDEELLRLREEKGVLRVFQEHRQSIVNLYREADPEYWARFVESQEKARANVMPLEQQQQQQQQQAESNEEPPAVEAGKEGGEIANVD